MNILIDHKKYTKSLTRIALGLVPSLFRSDNVVMFHMGRSGSSVLGNLLDQQPNLKWDGEIYEPGKMAPLIRLLPSYITDNPYKFLRSRMLQAGKNIYGFEMQYYHLSLIHASLSEFLDNLKRLGYSKYILLERKNHLRIILSILIAQKTSKWHHRQGEKSKQTQIRINVSNVFGHDGKTLTDYLEYYHRSFLEFKNHLSNLSFLSLTYEADILQNPIDGYRRVCDFLSFEKLEPNISYGKVNPYKIRDLVINFTEVQQALAETPFEWMLWE
jgi:hypothetical protein